MSEIYISVDIETDGPIPGANSMLSLGAVALTPDREQLGTFSINLVELQGAVPDPSTMAWWAKQPEAWKAAREDPQPPVPAMHRFSSWVKDMCQAAKGANPVFVGYPAGFDFMFVYWYLIKFLGDSPFSFSALDIKTYAAAVLGIPYRDVNKRVLERFKEPGLTHTHVAVDDALEQGYLFLNLKAARESLPTADDSVG
jgi:hypothetical protein